MTEAYVEEKVFVRFEPFEYFLVTLKCFLKVIGVQADVCAAAVGEFEAFVGQVSVFEGFNGLLVVAQILVCSTEIEPGQRAERIFFKDVRMIFGMIQRKTTCVKALLRLQDLPGGQL